MNSTNADTAVLTVDGELALVTRINVTLRDGTEEHGMYLTGPRSQGGAGNFEFMLDIGERNVMLPDWPDARTAELIEWIAQTGGILTTIED